MTDTTRDAAPKVGDKFAVSRGDGGRGVTPRTVSRITPSGLIELSGEHGLWKRTWTGRWTRRGDVHGFSSAEPWSDYSEVCYQRQRLKSRAAAAIDDMRAESTRSHLTEADVTTLESILAAAQARART